MNFTSSSYQYQDRSRMPTGSKQNKNQPTVQITQNIQNQRNQIKTSQENKKNNEIISSKSSKQAITFTGSFRNKTSLERNNQLKTSLHPQTANKITESINFTQSKFQNTKQMIPSRSKDKNVSIGQINQQIKQQRYKNSQYIRQNSMNKNKTETKHQIRQISTPQNIDQSKPFLKYYQQNIQLKNKQQQLIKQLQIVKNKLYEQSKVHHIQNQKQLALLAAGKKSLWNTKQPIKKQKNNTSKNIDENKISNLLEIIDLYKNKLLVAEQQIQNLKRQKYLLQQDGKIKQKKVDQIYKTFQQNTVKVNTIDLEQQLKNKTRQLETQLKRNQFNQIDINRLQAKIKTLQSNKQQLFDLRQQNKNLQQKILRLTQLPSFNVVTDRVDQQRKFKQLQNKYRAINQKYNQVIKDNIQVNAQLKLIRNQLIKANIESQQLQKQNYKLKQCMYQNPIITKLLEDQQLLNQVVFQIQKKKSNAGKLTSQLQVQSYDKILMEKQTLANQLTVLRNKMNALQQNWKQKQRISRMEKQEIISSFKQQTGQASKNQGKIMSKNGVAYTDDVSMFTQDTQNPPSGNNYFDLYLGQLHLLQSMMNTNFSIRNTQNSLILATVDFYNHNTEATRPVHGIHCNLQSQFSFKVSQDQFFFKYLNKGTFSIEIWASQGNKRNLIGKAVVDLRPLILKSRKNLTPVASSSATIEMNQKIMGSINFVMRLRMPIFEQLQRISQLQQIVNSQQSAPPRKLIIQIQEGRDFPLQSNTFVYFTFRLQDYYTKTYKGRTPVWNYYKAIQLKYNNDLKNYLRKNQLQLIVLDDNAVITGEGNSDVIGSAYISLLPLLQNKPIRDSVQVMKGTQRVGNIHIKIFWHETQIVDTGIKRQTDLKTIQQLVHQYLIRTKKTPDQLFQMLDKNKTGILSFDQFLLWIPKVSSKITVEMVDAYYKQFKKPINKINFQAKLTSAFTNQKNDIIKQFSQVNKIFSFNTEVIAKKQKLQDYLKDKDVYEVCIDIDTTADGKVSRQELQKYFDKHNIQLPAQTFGKQVQLAKLIRKYQNLQ